jgi:Na+-transporting NADH:ubiquinone oxidoreductase subunit NqrE
MNVCDFLTWSKNIHGHLGLMINSCIIVGLKEGLNATSYKLIYQKVLKPFVSCQLQLKMQFYFLTLQHFLLSTSLLILFQLCH